MNEVNKKKIVMPKKKLLTTSQINNQSPGNEGQDKTDGKAYLFASSEVGFGKLLMLLIQNSQGKTVASIDSTEKISIDKIETKISVLRSSFGKLLVCLTRLASFSARQDSLLTGGNNEKDNNYTQQGSVDSVQNSGINTSKVHNSLFDLGNNIKNQETNEQQQKNNVENHKPISNSDTIHGLTLLTDQILANQQANETTTPNSTTGNLPMSNPATSGGTTTEANDTWPISRQTSENTLSWESDNLTNSQFSNPFSELSSLYVKAKKACNEITPCQSWFRVAIDQGINKDIKFNWWIVGGTPNKTNE